MKKKELLAMRPLPATEIMLRTARENPIKTTRETRRTSWGATCTSDNSRSTYSRYFRAVVENDILKVAVFDQKSLQAGSTNPDYEVYCDHENGEFITYDTTEGKWREAKIDNFDYPGINWTSTSFHWQQDSDRALVNEYFCTGTNRDIQAAVLDFQATVRKEQLRKKHRSEIESIDEVMREVPELPKGFDEWVAKNCFPETMFYEPESACKGGRWQKMYCTHCRKWMDTLSWPNRPEHNKEGKCPKCGAPITYKSWNKQKYVFDEAYVGVLQRLADDSGWIIRTFHARMKREHSKGWEQYEMFAYEEQRARLDDAFREVEHFIYGEYKNTGVRRWCHEAYHRDGGYYGYYSNPSVGSLIMYTPNLKRELRKEEFCRVNLKKIFRGGERRRVEPVKLLRKLHQHPYVEYLQKSGLNTLTEEIFHNVERSELFDGSKKRIHEVLKLDKQRFQRLIQWDGGSEILRTLQYEQRTGQKITEHNIEFIKKNKIHVNSVLAETERTGMNLQRTLNYLEHQMELTGQDWDGIFRHYRDYLDMAAVFDMDITDEIVCRQPHLMEYHDRYLERKNRAKNKTRDKEVDIKYPDIKKNLKKNSARFEFKTEEFVIVVPRCASDITKEGRKQHHCVGATDIYISRMNVEDRFILFLRKAETPKIPYYTLEVTWDGEIKQFYAAYDRQPDREKIKAVLAEFTKAVQEREKELLKKLQECEKRDGTKLKRIGTEYVMTPVA